MFSASTETALNGDFSPESAIILESTIAKKKKFLDSL